jgi:hypothetical protein
MNEEQGKSSILPEDFDGIFRFTNWTDAEFTAKWNSVEYKFPPLSTIPLIIADATPIEIQNIRKKFAKELAIEVFYQTDKFKHLDDVKQGYRPPLYNDKDLAPYIQKCLEPLPLAKAKTKVLPRDNEDNYKKDPKGRNISRVINEDDSLVPEGASVLK